MAASPSTISTAAQARTAAAAAAAGDTQALLNLTPGSSTTSSSSRQAVPILGLRRRGLGQIGAAGAGPGGGLLAQVRTAAAGAGMVARGSRAAAGVGMRARGRAMVGPVGQVDPSGVGQAAAAWGMGVGVQGWQQSTAAAARGMVGEAGPLVGLIVPTGVSMVPAWQHSTAHPTTVSACCLIYHFAMS
jgi:hypothetical protein